MKDNKLDRIRRGVSMFRQQFLHSGAGVFDQALGEQELAARVSKLLTPYREQIYPPLEPCSCSLGRRCRLTAPARTL
jgi:hypothetical protein